MQWVGIFCSKTASSLRVIAGQVSLTDKEVNEQNLTVFSVTIFDKYNSANKTDDIALLKVTLDIEQIKQVIHVLIFETADCRYQIWWWWKFFNSCTNGYGFIKSKFYQVQRSWYCHSNWHNYGMGF